MGSYTTVIKACGRNKQGDRAEHWMKAMLAGEVMPDANACNAALFACVRAQDLPRLWKIYDLMVTNHIAADRVTYNSLAQIYSRCGDTERVEDIMYQCEMAGFALTEREYACLLAAYGNAWPRNVRKADNVFRSMVTTGITPGLPTLRFLQMAMGDKWAAELASELGIYEMPVKNQREGKEK